MQPSSSPRTLEMEPTPKEVTCIIEKYKEQRPLQTTAFTYEPSNGTLVQEEQKARPPISPYLDNGQINERLPSDPPSPNEFSTAEAAVRKNLMEQPPLEGPFNDPKTTSSGLSPPEIRTNSPSVTSRIDQITSLSSRLRGLIQNKMTRLDNFQNNPSFKNDDGSYSKILNQVYRAQSHPRVANKILPGPPQVILPLRPNSTSPSIVHSHQQSAEKRSKGSILHKARMLQEKHRNQMLTMARQSPILDRQISSLKKDSQPSPKRFGRRRSSNSRTSSNTPCSSEVLASQHQAVASQSSNLLPVVQPHHNWSQQRINLRQVPAPSDVEATEHLIEGSTPIDMSERQPPLAAERSRGGSSSVLLHAPTFNQAQEDRFNNWAHHNSMAMHSSGSNLFDSSHPVNGNRSSDQIAQPFTNQASFNPSDPAQTSHFERPPIEELARVRGELRQKQALIKQLEQQVVSIHKEFLQFSHEKEEEASILRSKIRTLQEKLAAEEAKKTEEERQMRIYLVKGQLQLQMDQMKQELKQLKKKQRREDEDEQSSAMKPKLRKAESQNQLLSQTISDKDEEISKLKLLIEKTVIENTMLKSLVGQQEEEDAPNPGEQEINKLFRTAFQRDYFQQREQLKEVAIENRQLQMDLAHVKRKHRDALAQCADIELIKTEKEELAAKHEALKNRYSDLRFQKETLDQRSIELEQQVKETYIKMERVWEKKMEAAIDLKLSRGAFTSRVQPRQAHAASNYLLNNQSNPNFIATASTAENFNVINIPSEEQLWQPSILKEGDFGGKYARTSQYPRNENLFNNTASSYSRMRRGSSRECCTAPFLKSFDSGHRRSRSGSRKKSPLTDVAPSEISIGGTRMTADLEKLLMKCRVDLATQDANPYPPGYSQYPPRPTQPSGLSGADHPHSTSRETRFPLESASEPAIHGSSSFKQRHVLIESHRDRLPESSRSLRMIGNPSDSKGSGFKQGQVIPHRTNTGQKQWADDLRHFPQPREDVDIQRPFDEATQGADRTAGTAPSEINSAGFEVARPSEATQFGNFNSVWYQMKQANETLGRHDTQISHTSNNPVQPSVLSNLREEGWFQSNSQDVDPSALVLKYEQRQSDKLDGKYFDTTGIVESRGSKVDGKQSSERAVTSGMAKSSYESERP